MSTIDSNLREMASLIELTSEIWNRTLDRTCCPLTRETSKEHELLETIVSVTLSHFSS